MQIAFSHYFGATVTMPLLPYEVETVGNVEYTRFTDGKHCPDPFKRELKEEKVVIFRKTTEGSLVRNEKAWDLWANRASATYVPINSQTGPFSARGMGSYA